ncbi:DUF2499 domain-containing protein [Heliobacterium gestii]|uniref:DUF2499 domain-containing protein n=1 Tax=Heliomicrobium gestii TaxID=2699 RepID=A0A845LBQ4_HELGE|nr:DUF2499 domain-containing protein [Heliomicrobium gestii]MBM7866472.1 hypothetical protein [Heliomicrobium gestii]MZP42744.1 DUF2499 domain-containing protein [Heliomicrobium gestii]
MFGFGFLSLPTWVVHIASLVEWAVAIVFVYRLGQRLHQVWIQRLPWVMIPYMLSGFCAIWYHLTYDTQTWLSDAQSYLTFIGSTSFGVWAFFFLRSLQTFRISSLSTRSASSPLSSLSTRSGGAGNAGNQEGEVSEHV